MRSRSTNRSGIVLRRRTLPAGDIIVTLLTPQGKVKGIARGGVRGPLASVLNLFHYVEAQLYARERDDLATVRQATLEGALTTLAQPERYPYAHLLAELSDLLFQEGEGEYAEQAFELFAGGLRGVSRHADPEWVGLVMSYKLLALSGFIVRAAQCVQCGEAWPEHPDPLGGQLMCRRCASLPAYPPETLEFLRQAARSSVRALMETPLPPDQREALWRALERFIAVQVGRVQSAQVSRARAMVLQGA